MFEMESLILYQSDFCFFLSFFLSRRVGAAISMAYVTGQPILFVGTGQTCQTHTNITIEENSGCGGSEINRVGSILFFSFLFLRYSRSRLKAHECEDSHSQLAQIIYHNVEQHTITIVRCILNF